MAKVTTILALPLVLLLLLVCAAINVSAYCPSNGNTRVIYVTSNMGDNIWSFDTQGNYIGEVINSNSFPSDVKVDKLRAMRFGPGGYLYVSSAKGAYSRIFAVSGNGLVNHSLRSDCTRDYLFTVVQQDKRNPLLDHPFDMVFHPVTHDLFVSNQNTMSISKYVLKSPPKSTKNARGAPRYPIWEPAPNVKSALPPNDALDTGISSRFENFSSGIPDNTGLFASTWSSAYFMNSVRGLAMSPLLPQSLVEGTAPPGAFSVDNSSEMMHYLVACDIATSTVHVFDPDTGDRLFGINVPSPVQVAFPDRLYNAPTTVLADGRVVRQYGVPYIYVTSKEDGMAYMIRFTSAKPGEATAGGSSLLQSQQQRQLEQPGGGVRAGRLFRITQPSPLHAASGLYENPSRDLILVADRNGRRINSYASPFLSDLKTSLGPTPYLGFFTKQLPDQPEFITSMLLEHQYNIPYCYELRPDGRFRYVALCTAARIWSSVLVAVLAVLAVYLIYQQGKRCFSVPVELSEAEKSQESITLLQSTTVRSYGATGH